MLKTVLSKYIFLSIYIIITFGSCKIQKQNNNSADNYIIYPPPPDTARVQYLTSISSSADIEGKQSKFSKFVLGEQTPLTISKPYGIEIRFGKIYLCDAGARLIVIIDLEQQKFLYFIPEGKGQLKKPINCYVDEKGYLYVADIERKQIVIFDKDGKYVNAVGEKENFKPSDVFVSDNKIWVCNLADNKINVFNNEGDYELINSFPNSEKTDDDFLFSPVNFQVTNDKVYVSDFGGFKTMIYNDKGNFISSIGSQGKAPGKFLRPKGIAVDKDENVYVVDAAFENAQIFDKDGNVKMYIGGHNANNGDMSLPAQIVIDYDNIKYFQQYVDPEYDLKYIILVTNQYGPNKINVYGRIEEKAKK